MKIKKEKLKKAPVEEILICPKCLKPTLKEAFNISGWMSNSTYRCTNPECGYVGNLYLTINPEEYEEFIKMKSRDLNEKSAEIDDKDNSL
ncbi:MAG: hypothetical protein ACTSU2_04935 [Promethearchaeota archaeon]